MWRKMSQASLAPASASCIDSCGILFEKFPLDPANFSLIKSNKLLKKIIRTTNYGCQKWWTETILNEIKLYAFMCMPNFLIHTRFLLAWLFRPICDKVVWRKNVTNCQSAHLCIDSCGILFKSFPLDPLNFPL